MTDQIRISELRSMAIVGSLAHEREAARPLQIDLVLDVDLHDAGWSGELGESGLSPIVAQSQVYETDPVPRTRDVDIVLYDDVVIESSELVVSHPRFAERRFVFTPLSEIPAGVHPLGPLGPA